ncbi:MAG: phosphodiester glycosidase family protein, partial [Microgenomates group bacterium]
DTRVISEKEKEVLPARIETEEADSENYSFVWLKVKDPKDLFLFPNFEEKLQLNEIIEKGDCRFLTSAGFYREDHSPIGLFISEEELLGKSVNNTTFNGYFTVTKGGKVDIAPVYSNEPLRIGLQAGPILIKEGIVQKLKIKDDESARRVIVALTEEGEIVFVAIYEKDSVFQGPYLAALPQTISDLQSEIGVEFTDALNLDGGTASVFYADNIKLSELTPFGSYFCIK